MAMSRSPRNVDMTVVTSSGAEVPMAPMVSPMTVSLTPSARALETAPPTAARRPRRPRPCRRPGAALGAAAAGRWPPHPCRLGLGHVGCLPTADPHHTGRVSDSSQPEDPSAQAGERAVDREQEEQERCRSHRGKVEPERRPLERDGHEQGAQARINRILTRLVPTMFPTARPGLPLTAASIPIASSGTLTTGAVSVQPYIPSRCTRNTVRSCVSMEALPRSGSRRRISWPMRCSHPTAPSSPCSTGQPEVAGSA
jgi:hypothetical protein